MSAADDVFTLKVDGNDENEAPVTNTEVNSSPLPRKIAPATATSTDAEEIDVNRLLATMQTDIEAAASKSESSMMCTKSTASMQSEESTQQIAETSGQEILKPSASSGASDAEATTEATEVVVPAMSAHHVDTVSIADRCAALLLSVSERPIKDSVGSTTSGSTVSGVDQITLMSDKVAKFALEAMNEDEPKYTEKEMDVLHKKAQVEAKQAFEEERHALLMQMQMMEGKLKEQQAEKESMKQEMKQVHQVVKGFEAMADEVAKKKDDEIYQLFEAKKQVQAEKKSLEDKLVSLEAVVATNAEAKNASDQMHLEDISNLKAAHKSELNEMQEKLRRAEDAAAAVKGLLSDAEEKNASLEKTKATLEDTNQKLQKSLTEATASCDKYKQIGTKTRDQAQAQLDKAKQLVVATKSECANLKHTVASLEDTCKTNVQQLEAEQRARKEAEEENSTLKAQVEKQTEDMKQLTLEAYRCNKAEQELEKQKKSNKELYDMCNELMKQVEANKKAS